MSETRDPLQCAHTVSGEPLARTGTDPSSGEPLATAPFVDPGSGEPLATTRFSDPGSGEPLALAPLASESGDTQGQVAPARGTSRIDIPAAPAFEVSRSVPRPASS